MTGRRVIVGVDGSDGAAEALRWAWRESRLRDLDLTAVMAWGYLDQHHPGGGRSFDPAYGEPDAERALRAAVEDALGADAAAVVSQTICDIPARALLEADADAALVVVGARGLGGFAGLLLGSTSQHVLHHATMPVAVVRHGSAAGFARTGRVVVGVDGSASSYAALGWALDEARRRDATLEVVHTWEMPYAGVPPFVGDAYDVALFDRAAHETVDAALADADVPAGLRLERRVREGSPAAALIEAGAEADVVVVAARGLGGFAGLLLGSVSQHVARHATCPVVVVPAGARRSERDVDQRLSGRA
jgi:nucleotide-binding universal stress UspA family protein